MKSSHSDIVVCETCSPAPRTHTGAFAQSVTYSSATSSTAQPPSLRMQQCSLVNGSAIIGPPSTSSTVIGSRYRASGLWAAFALAWTATEASCSSVVPYSCMWRRAAIAYLAISEWPYGTSNWRGPRAPKERFDVRRRALMSARAVEPYTSSTALAWPAAMASAAWAAMTSQVEPPTEVESTQLGFRPRYSATSTGARVPRPAEPKPSITSRPRPESASARRAAWACRAYGVASSTLPQSDRATPATATRRRGRADMTEDDMYLTVHQIECGAMASDVSRTASGHLDRRALL